MPKGRLSVCSASVLQRNIRPPEELSLLQDLQGQVVVRELDHIDPGENRVP